MLVGNHDDIHFASRCLDDVGADVLDGGWRRQFARRAGLVATVYQDIGRFPGFSTLECDQEAVAVADPIHPDDCAARRRIEVFSGRHDHAPI